MIPTNPSDKGGYSAGRDGLQKNFPMAAIEVRIRFVIIKYIYIHMFFVEPRVSMNVAMFDSL